MRRPHNKWFAPMTVTSFTKRFSVCTALLATALLAAPALAGGLGGEAARFQLFSVGDMSITNSNPDGGVATGGDFTASGVSMGSGLRPGVDEMIVAAGDVTLRNGTYHNGYVLVGGTPSISSSAHLPQAEVRQLMTSIDFADAQQEYVHLSDTLKATSATGETYVYPWRAIELRGLKDGLNVFHLTEQQYERSNGIAVPDFDPDLHTVVINVGGSDVVRGSNGSLFVGKINGNPTYEQLSSSGDYRRHRRLLWNFYEATRLTSNGSIHGAVLAPRAALTHQNGRLVGQVIAGGIDLRNAARIADAQFTGELVAGPTLLGFD